MKKLSFFFAVIFAITLVACSDDESPSFKKEDLMGAWESAEEDEEGCITTLEFGEEEITEISECDGDVFEASYGYEFDGKNTITTDVIEGLEVKIVTLNETTLKLKYSFQGYSETKTFTRVE